MADTAIDWTALAAWMTSRGLGTGAVTDVRRLAGGTQNILARFSRDGRDYVVRRPPLHPRPESNETMRREARVLAALAGSGVRHPELIAAEGSEDVLGHAFYLMAPVAGFTPIGELPPLHAGPPSIRRQMGLAMVAGLAALHALDPEAVGLADFGKPAAYLERQVQRWRSQLEGYAGFADWAGATSLGDVDRVARWLDANRPAGSMPGIVHGDFHLANVMFRHDGPELAAIVDWELATIGDPLVDLGWLLATWPDPADAGSIVSATPWHGFPSAAELVDHYAVHSARDLAAIGWYAVFACFKLAILLEGSNARAAAGKADRSVGDKLHARAIYLIAKAQRWIDGGAPVGTGRRAAA